MGSMKVHQFSRVFWEHEPSLSLGCKRLRPLAPKLNPDHSTSSTTTTNTVTSFDLKSFIRPDSGPRKLVSSDDKKGPLETHPGGTRWNPTQEQIGLLEMLYRGGMRTPNAQQIEQITAQLGRYGKIEGKNVFYWFQNHKARERQKQKRNSLGLSHSPRTPPAPISTTMSLDIMIPGEMVERDEDSPYKRKCRSWAFETLEVEERKSGSHGMDDSINNSSSNNSNGDRTLELFPLHPEGR